jgi:hypothetical protein
MEFNMPIKNNLSSLPKKLRERVRLPKIIRPPKEFSIIRSSIPELKKHMAKCEAFEKEAIQYFANAYEQNFEILKRHYGLQSDSELLVAVLKDFVPGFQMNVSKPGQRRKWSDEALMTLLVEVRQAKRVSKKTLSDIAALEIVKDIEPFKKIHPKVLKDKLPKAKKLPHQRFERGLLRMSKESRDRVVRHIRDKAKADLTPK